MTTCIRCSFREQTLIEGLRLIWTSPIIVASRGRRTGSPWLVQAFGRQSRVDVFVATKKIKARTVAGEKRGRV